MTKSLALVILAAAASVATAQTPAERPPVNQVSAEVGPCYAQIRVTDEHQRPVYAAKVTARVQYGLLGAKRVDLEGYTDNDGKIRLAELPDSVKKTILVHIVKGELESIVEVRPQENCHLEQSLVLG